MRSENIIESSVSTVGKRLSQQLQLQEAGHSQEIEKTEEEGRKTACESGEIGENCDFTGSAIVFSWLGIRDSLLNLRMHRFASNYGWLTESEGA